MKFTKTLVIGVSTFALAVSGALAADTKKDAKKDNDPGFNKLDKNNDGYLSRTEYLAVMTKKDLKGVKDKVAGNKDKDRSAATGSSKSK